MVAPPTPLQILEIWFNRALFFQKDGFPVPAKIWIWLETSTINRGWDPDASRIRLARNHQMPSRLALTCVRRSSDTFTQPDKCEILLGDGDGDQYNWNQYYVIYFLSIIIINNSNNNDSDYNIDRQCEQASPYHYILPFITVIIMLNILNSFPWCQPIFPLSAGSQQSTHPKPDKYLSPTSVFPSVITRMASAFLNLKASSRAKAGRAHETKHHMLQWYDWITSAPPSLQAYRTAAAKLLPPPACTMWTKRCMNWHHWWSAPPAYAGKSA